MKKKIGALILCMIMAASVFSGCGSDADKASTPSGGTATKQTESSASDTVSLKKYEGADTPQEAMEAYLEAIRTEKEDYILKTLHPSYARLLAEYETGNNKERDVLSFWNSIGLWDAENRCASIKKFDIEILEDIEYSADNVRLVSALAERTEEQEKIVDRALYYVKLSSKDAETECCIPVGKTVAGKWYAYSIDADGNWEARPEIAEEKDAKIAAIQKYLDDISANIENSLNALSPLYVQIQTSAKECGTVNGIDYEKLFHEKLENFEKKPKKLFEGGEIQGILWYVDGDQNRIGNIWGTNSIRETCDWEKRYHPDLSFISVFNDYEAKAETRAAVTAQLRMLQGEDVYDAAVNFYLVKYDGTWYVEDLGGLTPVK